MSKTFITSTLKSAWNRDFNPKLCAALEEKNVQCYLPQRDTDQNSNFEVLFHQNTSAISTCSKLLAIAENESINWGLEVGFAAGISKDIIVLCQKDHEIPVMCLGFPTEVVRVNDLNNIEEYISKLAKLLSGNKND